MANANGSVFGVGAVEVAPTKDARVLVAAAGTSGVEYVPMIKLRGTVLGHAWPGVTEGTGKTSLERQATGAALQAAIDYASNNGKYFELWPGTYEIELAGGLVIPDGYSKGIVWRGGRGTAGTTIVQYSDNTPILTCGSDSGNGYRIDIDGVTLRYGNSQSGNTSSDCMLIKACWRSEFRHIDVEGGYNGIHINGGSFYFQNTMEHIKGHNCFQNIFYWQRFGTGSIFRDMYLHQGGAPTVASIGGSVFKVDGGGAAQAESIFEQINVEWTQCRYPMYLKGLRNGTFISTHFEGNVLAGDTPALVYLEGSYVDFIGGDWIENRMLAANVTAGKPSLFLDAYDSVVNTRNLTLGQNTYLSHDTEWYGVNRGSYLANDAPSRVDIGTLKFIDSFSGSMGSNFSETNKVSKSDFSGARVVSVSSIEQYAGLPQVEKARIHMTGAAYTLYGMYNKPMISSSTTAGAARTITLSNKMGPAGSTGANHPIPVGREATVYRQGGAADGFDLVVKNHDGTTLATIAASDTTQQFYYDGTNWVAG